MVDLLEFRVQARSRVRLGLNLVFVVAFVRHSGELVRLLDDSCIDLSLRDMGSPGCEFMTRTDLARLSPEVFVFLLHFKTVLMILFA